MILIIDDDLAVRTSLVLLLETEGHTVRTAENHKKAMSELNGHRFELIILDLNFSIETSGREGMRLLQEIREKTNAPVILITGWGSIELAVEGMKLGANDFITKPWTNSHLLQSVNTLLQLKSHSKNALSRRQLDQKYDFAHIIGEDPKMLELLEAIGRVAETDASVLIM